MDNRELLKQLTYVEGLLVDRQGSDPLFQFQPHAKQRAFIDAVLYDKFHENWFLAANRSGKSDAGAYAGACLARFGGDPKGAYSSGGRVVVYDHATAGLVSSLTFKMSQTVIEPKYFNNGLGAAGSHEPFIPEREIQEWRASDRILKMKNGSLVYFLAQAQEQERYQGLTLDWAHLDEEHKEQVVNEIRIRIGGGRRLRIFGTATILPPPGQVGGVTWMFSKVIQPFLDGKLPNVGLFGASIYDNPHISREEIALVESQYGDIEGRIRLGGEWLPGISGARAYPSFDRRVHRQEQPEIRSRQPLCWIWDFNVEPMCSIVGQRHGRTFRVFKELILEEGSVSDMCEYFVEQFPRHLGEIWVYGDATSNKRVGQTGISDYRTIQNNMRRYGSPLRLKVPESNPFVPDRLSAVNRSFKTEDGESLVEIDPSCVELIADFEQVLRDARGGIKKTFDRNDPYYRRTHTSDAFGYWISKEEPVRRILERQGNVIPLKQPGYGFAG